MGGGGVAPRGHGERVVSTVDNRALVTSTCSSTQESKQMKIEKVPPLNANANKTQTDAKYQRGYYLF